MSFVTAFGSASVCMLVKYFREHSGDREQSFHAMARLHGAGD